MRARNQHTELKPALSFFGFDAAEPGGGAGSPADGGFESDLNGPSSSQFVFRSIGLRANASATPILDEHLKPPATSTAVPGLLAGSIAVGDTSLLVSRLQLIGVVGVNAGTGSRGGRGGEPRRGVPEPGGEIASKSSSLKRFESSVTETDAPV